MKAGGLQYRPREPVHQGGVHWAPLERHGVRISMDVQGLLYGDLTKKQGADSNSTPG